MKLIINGSLSRKSTTFPTKPQGYDSKLNNAERRKAPKRARVAVAYRRLEGLERNDATALWGADMQSVMKHAYICGAIRPVRVLRRRFVAFPEARLQLALKRKALAGQWSDADDGDYSRLHSWR